MIKPHETLLSPGAGFSAGIGFVRVIPRPFNSFGAQTFFRFNKF